MSSELCEFFLSFNFHITCDINEAQVLKLLFYRYAQVIFFQ